MIAHPFTVSMVLLVTAAVSSAAPIDQSLPGLSLAQLSRLSDAKMASGLIYDCRDEA